MHTNSSLPSKFNIRVYGILLNDNDEVLITDEHQFDFKFSKFPGGGLEFGEGPEECLIREFKEELDLEVEIEKHFYTTGFYMQSAFVKEHQIISIYYQVKCNNWRTIEVVNNRFENLGENKQVFRWQKKGEINIDELDFPIDKFVAQLLNENS